ncbi:DUF1491 family protein [Pontitalea aquivivens]|uniref:DUF1491 family protein n=1 Tax=Pontitalea aquivivens TaxID=3388663 RepID=UPI0039705CA0
MTARLASDVWVRAYLKRLELACIPAYVTAHGHAEAGAILIKCATLDARARALHRSFDLLTGQRAWVTLAEGPEPEVDAAIARQRKFDPDLWVIEIESRQGRTLLDEEGLAD